MDNPANLALSILTLAAFVACWSAPVVLLVVLVRRHGKKKRAAAAAHAGRHAAASGASRQADAASGVSRGSGAVQAGRVSAPSAAASQGALHTPSSGAMSRSASGVVAPSASAAATSRRRRSSSSATPSPTPNVLNGLPLTPEAVRAQSAAYDALHHHERAFERQRESLRRENPAPQNEDGALTSLFETTLGLLTTASVLEQIHDTWEEEQEWEDAATAYYNKTGKWPRNPYDME